MSGELAGIRMRLPATSANLGSGFDTAAVALNFFLDVEARAAQEFSIHAEGSDSDVCSRLENNLILDIYKRILEENGRPAVPLAVRMSNAIPLGMGCGSSAAGRLAAVSLAVHFGQLHWPPERILEEACLLEGHPDNAAACWLGGFVAAALEGRSVRVARAEPPKDWRAIVVLPSSALPTARSRAVLPARYTRADVVANLQAVSMLGLAFSQGRGELLKTAMRDRIHQPYREEICPLLPRLLPLAGSSGILGVALSGAGPAVLAITESAEVIPSASQAILGALTELPTPRLLACGFQSAGAQSEAVSAVFT